MKYLIPVLVLFTSCVNHENSVDDTTYFPNPLTQVEIKYAKGLEINYHEKYTTLVSKSLKGNDFYRDSLVLVHAEDHKLEVNKTLGKLLTSINCQSSTHLAFIDFFDQLNLVTGLCGLDFVQEGKIKEALNKNQTKEVCLGENIQLESVLETDPDLFFVYPFAISQVETLEKSGVKTIMIAEYLETHPLARLEWLKFFGVLFQKEIVANTYFNQVEEEYNSLIQAEPDTNKRFIFNLPFGENWFTPSANSLIVKLLEDAGLCYYYDDEIGTENIVHSQEKVWNDGALAPYWVIIADRPPSYCLADLKKEAEVYSTFKSVMNEQVIFCNSRTTDYFLTGVIEPHVMLKDILFATHKIDQHEPSYFKLLK